uniref:uncharacterized protein LOC100182468 isoform X2 n=1 Tax=Ciona intestinalis TaxID=7719 RepID=UPI000EF4A01A|nr:uncharacterized protein LOC100182468 isoform X2 [Ciona intestinalis]|eukprot:XP_026693478.1 uncharacterized protein LOC100182468 isoform X2 [Ciona intestinalis]
MEQGPNRQTGLMDRPSANDFVENVSPKVRTHTEEKREDFFSRKGVITMEEGGERCTHTAVPPSAMMTLAMELLVSNRGKASKIFQDAKLKTQVSTDEEDESNLPKLWVVPSATSEGEAPVASHLKPAMDNADFVTLSSQECLDVENREENDDTTPEINFQDLKFSVADLIGSEDKVFRYSDDDDDVTVENTSPSHEQLTVGGGDLNEPLLKDGTKQHDSLIHNNDISINAQCFGTAGVINPSVTYQTDVPLTQGSNGFIASLTDKPITVREPNHVINDHAATLSESEVNKTTSCLDSNLEHDASHCTRQSKSQICSDVTLSPGRDYFSLSSKERDSDSISITPGSNLISSNHHTVHRELRNDNLDRVVRGAQMADASGFSSAPSRSSSSLSLCSLGSLSSASLQLSMTSGKVSVASCVSLTPDSLDLCERKCLGVSNLTDACGRCALTSSYGKLPLNEQHFESASKLKMASFEPIYGCDGCGSAGTSAANALNVPLQYNSQLNDASLKITRLRSRSTSSDRGRSNCVSPKSPSRKVICKYSEQEPAKASPVLPGKVISQAVFPEAENPTLATPVLFLKKQKCTGCGQHADMPALCCCIRSKPKAPPRTDSRGAVDKFSVRNEDSKARRSSSSSSQDSEPRLVKEQERVLNSDDVTKHDVIRSKSDIIEKQGEVLISDDVKESTDDVLHLIKNEDSEHKVILTSTSNTISELPVVAECWTTEKQTNKEENEKQAACVTTRTHRDGCRVTLSNLNEGKRAGNRLVVQETGLNGECSTARGKQLVTADDIVCASSSMPLSEQWKHEKEMPSRNDQQETIIEGEGTGRIRVVGGSKITLLKGIRGPGQALESSRTSPSRKIVIMTDDDIDMGHNVHGKDKQAAPDSVLGKGCELKRHNDNCEAITELNASSQVRPIESRVVASHSDVTSTSINGNGPISKQESSGITEACLNTSNAEKSVEQIVVEPSFVSFEGQKVYKASTPYRSPVTSTISSQECSSFRNKVTIVHKKPDFPSTSPEPQGKMKLKKEVIAKRQASSPRVKTPDVKDAKSYTSTVTLSLKPSAKVRTPTENKEDLSFYTNPGANPEYHKWVQQWTTCEKDAVAISPIRDHVREFNSKNDKPVMPTRNCVGARNRIQSNVEYSRIPHVRDNARTQSSSVSTMFGEQSHDGAKDPEATMTSPPPHSVTDDEEFSGVVEAPLKNVKDIRAMFKKGPDYKNYAKPRSLSSNSASKQEEKVAKQVMGMFQGALDIEKELAVFEEERLSQSSNISPIKQNGHAVITTTYTQERNVTTPKSSSVTSPTSTSSGENNSNDDIAPEDIRTSIAKIKSESATVASFDESLDQFYDVLNDLTS